MCTLEYCGLFHCPFGVLFRHSFQVFPGLLEASRSVAPCSVSMVHLSVGMFSCPVVVSVTLFFVVFLLASHCFSLASRLRARIIFILPKDTE